MDPVVIPFAFPGVPGVRCAFQTRVGGVGRGEYGQGNISFDVGDDPAHVRANRRALQERLGFAAWLEMRQVHGFEMRFDPDDGDPDGPGSEEADGQATSRPGRALVVKTADCQPVMLAHASGRFVAGLHVGWRGNRINFPETGTRAFCARYGLDPAEVLAVRGPSLGPSASQFVNFDREWGEEFEDYLDQASMTVDLWRMTRDQLMAAGLKPRNIFSVDLCTHSLPDAFFSYRRAKASGRQAGLIWIA